MAALAPVARADDSLIKVSEVYSDGSAAHGDYVELQLAADGQQVPAGHQLVGFAANGSGFAITFPPNSKFTDNQRTLLIGWPENSSADFTASPFFNFQLPGGAACLASSTNPFVAIDCVSWGSFPAGTSSGIGAGPPAAALTASQSLTRTIIANCPTLLDPADDTNQSLYDFALATPSPRNNAAPPTETLCPVPITVKRGCKKGKKHRSAEAAKKKRCKKRKH
jgi:hypothetical protein